MLCSAATLAQPGQSAALAASAAPPGEPELAPVSGVVSVADGPAFVLIRRVSLSSAGRGAVLAPGDIIETQPGAFLVVELRVGDGVGALVGIGPATRAYWRERGPSPTFGVLAGWIKVDTQSAARPAEVRTEGVRLAADSQSGVYVLHAGVEADEVFHESGAMTVSIPATPGGGAPSPANEWVSSNSAGAIQRRLGPGVAFAAALPAPLRDPLPMGVATRLRGAAEPQFIREVAYEDICDWLDGPRSWRQGFITRFRPRLKDRAFFSQLDAHLRAHPEWAPLLHPPPALRSPQPANP